MEVQAIINIILDEADTSIDKAYKEGYKQATVELLPEVDYWKTLYNSQKKRTVIDSFKLSLVGIGTGFIAGGIIGICIPIN